MHQEAITSKGKKIFSKFSNFPDFYLAGGTGLALYLGHRISVDFDFFWEEDIPEGVLPKIRRVFKGHEIEVIINHSEQLSVLIDGVSVSFVRYPYPVISDFKKHEGVKILSALEIAATKAYVLGMRSTLKDYIDLYFFIKLDKGLTDIMDFCDKKYSAQFNRKLFLEQLIYFDDIEDMEIQFLKQKVTKEQLEVFFKKEVEKLKLR